LLTAWRIVKKRYAVSAFDGEGARLYGGRWNSPGVAVVYVASTRSLAALEMAVHLDRATLLDSFALIPCEFDQRLVTVVEVGSLAADWRDSPQPSEIARIGDTWAKELRSVVLAVPSAIIDGERNFLLNPAHPDFAQVKVGDPHDFVFDRRLIK
jgi:RES domain-containing protein